MRGTGYVIHWNREKGRGMIHLGGRGHSALLGFVSADCDARLKNQLRMGDIPTAAPLRVQFGLSIRKGTVLGERVSLPPAKKATARKKSGRRRKARRRS